MHSTTTPCGEGGGELYFVNGVAVVPDVSRRVQRCSSPRYKPKVSRNLW